MASSSQVRAWWRGYECANARMVSVVFPGDGRTWSLKVADKSAPIWRAASEVMTFHAYLFRESAGGTYNCRPPSLHAYGLALDLNPSKNPMQWPVVTDMPRPFVDAMLSIRANGKQALTWGGDWPQSNPPDPMHFQVDVAPADVTNVTWPKPPPTVEENMLPLEPTSATEDIRSLQNRLNLAYGSGLSLDGSWGASTSAAVKANLGSLTGDPVAAAGNRVVARQWDQILLDLIAKHGGDAGGLNRGDSVILQ